MTSVTSERWQRIVAALAVIALVVVAVRVGSSDSASVEFKAAGEWLETGVTGSVVLVSGSTGEVVSRATVAEPESSLSAVTSDGSAVVLDRNDSTVSLLSGATQEVSRSLDTEVGGNQLDVLGTAEVVYLIQPSSVRVLDPATLAVLDDVEIEAFPDERVVDETGRLWTYSRKTGDLHNISVDGNSSRKVAAPSQLIASGNDALLLSAGEGWFSLSAATGGSVLSCPTDAELEDLVAGSDGRFGFVSTSDGGTVWAIDFSSPSCESTIAIDDDVSLSVAVADDGFGYAGDIETGEVVSLNLQTPELLGQDRFSVQDVGFDLYALDGIVWANEPTGARAAIFDDGELKETVDKVGFSDPTGAESAADTGQSSLLDVDEATLGLLSALQEADADDDVEVAGEQLAADEAPQALDEPDPDGSLRANFTLSQQIAVIGEEIAFADRSSGSPTSFVWDFGDGELGSGPEVSHAWDAEGDYEVELVVDDGETSDSVSVTVTIVNEDASGPPVASFRSSESIVEVGQSIVFNDASFGSPSSFAWSFGDGTTGAGSSVTKAWSQAGVYQVVLEVRNDYGTDSTSRSITVLGNVAPPRVTISAAPDSLAAGQFGSFVASTRGNPTSIEWDFGDGNTEEGASVSHSWLTPGSYTVTVRVSNSLGSDSDWVVVDVGDAVAPVAQFRISSTTVAAGESVSVVSTSLNAPTSTRWDFGDGTSATGASARHTYQDPGRYSVTLTVENAAGTDAASKTVSVTQAGAVPIASFSYSPAAPTVGAVVSFTDLSLNSPTEWRWDFGDGVVSQARNPAHVFLTAGSQRVTLTATNGSGSSSTTQVINVNVAAPAANFAFAPNPAIAGRPVTFTDLSSGAPTAWRWNFGDGSTSSERNPSHVFTEGTYRVTLTAVTAGGESTKARRVRVGPALPVAAFSLVPQDPRVGQAVNFQNNSTGGDGYLWDFGDGDTSTLRDPGPRVYNQPGPRSVTLTVSNVSGSASVTQNFIVRVAPPTASFTVSPGPYMIGQPITFTSTSTGQINSHEWTFGAIGTGTGPVATHTFNLVGSKTIRLTVSGPGGPPSTAEMVIQVTAPEPVANFTWSANPTAGAPVQFTNLSSDATTYVWTFGDGTGQSGATNPSHTFAAAGSYNVTLSATGPGGTSQRVLTVLVAESPP